MSWNGEKVGLHWSRVRWNDVIGRDDRGGRCR
jgi:hypothetical protein